jgi:hypothetical protein
MRGTRGVNRPCLRAGRQGTVLADPQRTGQRYGDSSRVHVHNRTAGRSLKALREWQVRRGTRLGHDSTEGGFAMLDVLMASTLFAVVILAAGSGTMASTVAASIAQQRSVAYTLVW